MARHLMKLDLDVHRPFLVASSFATIVQLMLDLAAWSAEHGRRIYLRSKKKLNGMHVRLFGALEQAWQMRR